MAHLVGAAVPHSRRDRPPVSRSPARRVRSQISDGRERVGMGVAASSQSQQRASGVVETTRRLGPNPRRSTVRAESQRQGGAGTGKRGGIYGFVPGTARVRFDSGPLPLSFVRRKSKN